MTEKILAKGDFIYNCLADYFKGKDVEVYNTNSDGMSFDLICLENIPPEEFGETEFHCPIINLHYSLLPSFKEKDAEKKAFLSGVKVSGVTIHSVFDNEFYGKILAQYPVLIGSTTHYDEYLAELRAVSSKILPPVAEAILNDRVFDFSDLFKHNCSGSCGSCAGCGH